MLKYVARRLAEVVPTTFGIVLLAFVLFNVVVGSSPALTILGKGADERSIAAFNKRYGYDKPLIVGKWGSVEGEKAWKGLLDSQFCILRNLRLRSVVHRDQIVFTIYFEAQIHCIDNAIDGERFRFKPYLPFLFFCAVCLTILLIVLLAVLEAVLLIVLLTFSHCVSHGRINFFNTFFGKVENRGITLVRFALL